MITGQVEQGTLLTLMSSLLLPLLPPLLSFPFSIPLPSYSPPAFQGRGTVITGRVEQGVVKVGDEMEIVGIKVREATDGRHFMPFLVMAGAV